MDENAKAVMYGTLTGNAEALSGLACDRAKECGCEVSLYSLDEALQRAGRKCFHERKELDLDFDEHFDDWMDLMFNELNNLPKANKI